VGTLISLIAGRVVAFDSAPVIYFIEEHPLYLGLADELFDALDRGQAQGMTSTLTLMEVLVRPLRAGRRDLVEAYRRLLTRAMGIALHPVDERTCESAAQLRANQPWLRTPDALQVATALEHGADLMVTNDDRWRRLREIQIVVLKDYVGASP
jgi:predicted nucleic acid-binding protein